MSQDVRQATPEPSGDLEARYELLLAECRAMRRQNALNEMIVRDLPAGLAILDRDLTYRKVNANYARYLDRSVEYFEGLNVFDVVPCSEPYLAELFRTVLERGEEVHKQEYLVRYTDDRGTHDSYWDFSYAPLLDDHGVPEGIIVLAQEVSERVRMRQALESQRAFLGAIVDNMEEGIVACDASGVLTMFNEAEQTMHAHPFEPVPYQRWPALYGLHHLDGTLMRPEETPLCRAWQGEHLQGEELLVVNADEAPRLMSVSGGPLHDAAGTKLGAVIVQADITEQRQLERMKDEFVSMVSHELRTPLTSIRAPLLMLASGVVSSESPKGREMLAIAARNAERMVRLVNDILDVQRLATGQLNMKPTPCDASGVLDEAVETMRPMAEEAGVTLRVVGESLPMRADATRIVQVLTNLIDNALSFSPAEGTVTVGAERRDGEAVFWVSDEGPGVPADQRALIFERFKQADATLTRQKKGTGLGLAICQAIVEQHGGRIWVDDGPAPGATFRFSLPLTASGSDV